MRAYSLNRRITSPHFGDHGVVIVRVQPSPVAHLPTGLGIERRVIKNDLAFFASLKLPHALPLVDDRQNLASVRPRLPITFKLRFRKLLIGRIRRLLRRTLPRRASASFLFLHRAIETSLIEINPEIAAELDDKIKGQAICVIELECVRTRISQRKLLLPDHA